MPNRECSKAEHSRGCVVEWTLSRIGGKWKGVILWHLQDGTLRFSQLRRQIPNVTQRMLTNQLRELEADGLLIRTVHAEVPPRVEYRLSDLGRTLGPVINALKDWGDTYLDPTGAPIAPAAHKVPPLPPCPASA